MPQMDYSKLRGRIRECGRTQREVAEFANMANTTFSLKLKEKYKQFLNFLKYPQKRLAIIFLRQKFR